MFVVTRVVWPAVMKATSEAEFLDEIQTKVLGIFLLAIHSHLYSFAFLQTHATSYSFYSLVTAVTVTL